MVLRRDLKKNSGILNWMLSNIPATLSPTIYTLNTASDNSEKEVILIRVNPLIVSE
jgi:hypothetical protein